MAKIQIKICEKCGKEFGCGVDDGKSCWCTETPLSQETLDYLRRQYQDCLCPPCLESFERLK